MQVYVLVPYWRESLPSPIPAYVAARSWRSCSALPYLEGNSWIRDRRHRFSITCRFSWRVFSLRLIRHAPRLEAVLDLGFGCCLWLAAGLVYGSQASHIVLPFVIVLLYLAAFRGRLCF